MKLLKCVLLVPWLAACAGLSGADEDSSTGIQCDDVFTTVEINRCAKKELQQSESELQLYYETVVEANRDDEVFLDSLKQSQAQWLSYRDSHCDSVYRYWREGTIRGVMSLACKTQLSQQRTLQLWQSFLTFVDGSEPAMPKPEYFLEQ